MEIFLFFRFDWNPFCWNFGRQKSHTRNEKWNWTEKYWFFFLRCCCRCCCCSSVYVYVWWKIRGTLRKKKYQPKITTSRQSRAAQHTKSVNNFIPIGDAMSLFCIRMYAFGMHACVCVHLIPHTYREVERKSKRDTFIRCTLNWTIWMIDRDKARKLEFVWNASLSNNFLLLSVSFINFDFQCDREKKSSWLKCISMESTLIASLMSNVSNRCVS